MGQICTFGQDPGYPVPGYQAKKFRVFRVLLELTCPSLKPSSKLYSTYVISVAQNKGGARPPGIPKWSGAPPPPKSEMSKLFGG